MPEQLTLEQMGEAGGSMTSPAGADEGARLGTQDGAGDTKPHQARRSRTKKASADKSKKASGAMTSRRKAKKNTVNGSAPGPKPGAPEKVELPYLVASSSAWLFDNGAKEILTFAGAGELRVGQQWPELGPGLWVLARLTDEVRALPPNVVYVVPKHGAG